MHFGNNKLKETGDRAEIIQNLMAAIFEALEIENETCAEIAQSYSMGIGKEISQAIRNRYAKCVEIKT